MSVPAIDTSKIGTFSWWKQSGCTEVVLADCLGILHSYNQYPEYIDGTIKIFDSGSESVAPNNYNLVNVRIRSDGYILAWFNQDITASDQTSDSGTGYILTDSNCQIQNYHDSTPRAIVANELAGNMLEFTSGTLSGNIYTIQSNTLTTITLYPKYGHNLDTNLATVGTDTYKINPSRGSLVWWGHTSTAHGNPTNQSTRLGRAIYEIWEQLKGNQVGGSGAVVDYTKINYYDYEHTNALNLYILGDTDGYSTSASGYVYTNDAYFYSTIPSGKTIYDGVLIYGYKSYRAQTGDNIFTFSHNYDDILNITFSGAATNESNGYANVNFTPVSSIQNTHRMYSYMSTSGISVRNVYANNAIVILTS